MKQTSKLSLMAVGLILALSAVAAVRSSLESASSSPSDSLAIENGSTAAEGSSVPQPRVSQQPRILQARPFVRDERPNPPYREMTTESAETTTAKFPANPATANEGGEWPVKADSATWPAEQKVPNALAEDLLDSAIRIPSDQEGGWPLEDAGQAETWTTAENDSLWDVSVARYGTGAYYHALFAQNRTRIHRPDRIVAGLILETPSISELRENFPDLCPAAAPGRVAPASAQNVNGAVFPR